MNRLVRRISSQRDEGFGMVEIVVALFMLAILSISFLPLLIQGLTLSAENATRATATQILHDRLEAVRTQSVKCDTLYSAINGTATSATVDPRGISFQVKTLVAACPTPAASYPGTVTVTVEVRRLDDLSADPLASATTLVFVKSKA